MERSSKLKKSRMSVKNKEVSNLSLLKLPPLEKESSNGKETQNQKKVQFSGEIINLKKEEDEQDNKVEQNKIILDFTNCIFFSKYKIKKKISEGNFSKIYQLIEINTNDKYACKIEAKKANQPMLENEYKILDYLRGDYIPSIKLYGSSGDYNILIMNLLGKSLDYYIKKLETFSIHTTSMLAYQIINILQYIHLRGIIHRDIKPGNFVMGLDTKSLDVYIIDFGFARKYKSMTTDKMYPMTEGHELTGTSRYASINAMKGMQQSCRDD